ncbi:MAG: DnaJ domain-containing protein [Candidatus Brocadiia bacterium]
MPTMRDTDYYQLLGVGRDASVEEVTRAFQRLGKKYHPRMNPGDPAAPRIFEQLVAAYRVLSDPQARRAYDRRLRARGRRPRVRSADEFFARRRGQPLAAARPRRATATVRRAARPAAPPVATLGHTARSTAWRLPWWGISAAVHAVLIVVLAIWPARVASQEEYIGPVQVELVEVPPPPPPMDVTAPDIEPQPTFSQPTIAKPEPEPVVDPKAIEEYEKQQRTAVMAVPGKGAFGLRGSRGDLVDRRGGPTTASENAVEEGLLWLAENQLKTGGWQTDRPVSQWAAPGVTGLATLSFLGAGYTHRNASVHRQVVERALGYIKRMQDTEGCIAFSKGGRRIGRYMYCHAICALALAEAYAMTEDPTLKESAQRAIDFIVEHQNSTGGWRYYADTMEADSSVSGWMVMALHSARIAGLEVPEAAMDRARKFFQAVTKEDTGLTLYMPGGRGFTMALAAVGLLCNQYLGIQGDHPYIQRAGKVINHYPPKWVDTHDFAILQTLPGEDPGANNYYYWYYASLALHQRRGDAWDKWHPKMRSLLVQIQEKGGPREGESEEDEPTSLRARRQRRNRGSWPPYTLWAREGGRVYATALAILTLEVYYRYAPIYREVVDKQLATFGRAAAAFNRFVALARAEKTDAQGAAREARSQLQSFLQMSKPQEGQALERATARRRAQAATMLLDLHRVQRNYREAIEALQDFDQRFPGAFDEAEREKLLAECYLGLARKLEEAGKPEEARQAEGEALERFLALLAREPGAKPDLERWLARRLADRGEWRKALRLYLDRARPLVDKGLDPRTEEGKRAAALFQRIVEAYSALGEQARAAEWLGRLEDLVGPSLELSLRRARMLRQQGHYDQELAIYQATLPRLDKYSDAWWRVKRRELEAALELGRRDSVRREIERLEVLQPDLGGEAHRERILELLRQAREAG